MNTTVKISLSLLFALSVATCAAYLGGRRHAPPAQSNQVITVGQTTKTELDAAFGPATAISFDAGYDVWIYKGPATDARRFLPRLLTPKPTREVVVLFDADGRVSKYRVREPRG